MSGVLQISRVYGDRNIYATWDGGRFANLHFDSPESPVFDHISVSWNFRTRTHNLTAPFTLAGLNSVLDRFIEEFGDLDIFIDYLDECRRDTDAGGMQ